MTKKRQKKSILLKIIKQMKKRYILFPVSYKNMVMTAL